MFFHFNIYLLMITAVFHLKREFQEALKREAVAG